MQEDDTTFALALTGLDQTQIVALFGLISWAASQAEDDEEATLRVIAAVAAGGAATRSSD